MCTRCTFKEQNKPIYILNIFSDCDSNNMNGSTTANLLRKEISILLTIKGNKFNDTVILTKSSCFEGSHKDGLSSSGLESFARRNSLK